MKKIFLAASMLVTAFSLKAENVVPAETTAPVAQQELTPEQQAEMKKAIEAATKIINEAVAEAAAEAGKAA